MTKKNEETQVIVVDEAVVTLPDNFEKDLTASIISSQSPGRLASKQKSSLTTSISREYLPCSKKSFYTKESLVYLVETFNPGHISGVC